MIQGTFAQALRGWGVDAEATRQATRGTDRNYGSLWQVKAAARGDLRKSFDPRKGGVLAAATRFQAGMAWAEILIALRESPNTTDRQLVAAVEAMLANSARRSRSISGSAERNTPAALAPARSPSR